ncbi:MAG: uronate dehydrogenase [Gaiellaceae bacterium]|jgi:nucleoside-diphosphate-sugar epimerase|nr:uronate dehydrogenase [Gaiellaceae bacterium]
MGRVLVLGASGVVGSVLWDGLSGERELRGIDRRRDSARDIDRGDATKPRTLRRALDGVDAVIDLATGSRLDIGWADVHRDMAGRVAVLEAMCELGVRRYVFASSNHVTGMYERDEPYAAIVAGEYGGLDPSSIPLIGADWPIRPDSPYGVGKAFVEALTRHYAEEQGLSCICLRIGTVLAADRPTSPRHFATLLSHADLVRLVRGALDAPAELRYGVYYGVSANTWRFWDLANARAEIDYEARDDAERFRA